MGGGFNTGLGLKKWYPGPRSLLPGACRAALTDFHRLMRYQWHDVPTCADRAQMPPGPDRVKPERRSLPGLFAVNAL